MSNSTDYYQILGVTPSADLAVIKAVYKALALKFHPDRNKDNPVAAAKRMSEINEAYSVLSDENKRAEYDRSRRGSSEQDQFEDEPEGFDTEFGSMDSQIEADWALARKYYPDLDSILVNLNQVSKSLIIPYKLTVLEKQIFPQRKTLADQMIDDYLQTYFGKNAEIKDFAKFLLKKGRRDAALELNKVVRVLGSGIDTNAVKSQIARDFDVFRDEREEAKRNAEEQKKRDAEREEWDIRAARHYEKKRKDISEVYYSGGIGTKITIFLIIMIFWVAAMSYFFE
jgi:curved DNA-binding protein CbpA